MKSALWLMSLPFLVGVVGVFGVMQLARWKVNHWIAMLLRRL